MFCAREILQVLIIIQQNDKSTKECVAILSFSTKKWTISGRHSPNANTQNWLWIRWRKGLTGPPGRSLMGLTIRALQAPRTLPIKLKPIDIVIPYIQGLCKSIEKICVKYGIQTNIKGGSTIKNLLVSPKDKDPMVSKVGPYIGSNVVTLHVMMNT